MFSLQHGCRCAVIFQAAHFSPHAACFFLAWRGESEVDLDVPRCGVATFREASPYSTNHVPNAKNTGQSNRGALENASVE